MYGTLNGYKVTWKFRTQYDAAKRIFKGQRTDPLMAHDDANRTLYLEESKDVHEFLNLLPDGTCTVDKVDVARALADLLSPGNMICKDCLLPLRECKCENWHGTDGDDEDPDTNDYLGDADPRTHGVDAPEYVDDTDDEHPAAICPACGREMEWEHYDDEENVDIYRCLTEDCPVGDDVPISREDAERDEAILLRDAELGVYSYAPDGCVAYDKTEPECCPHCGEPMRHTHTDADGWLWYKCENEEECGSGAVSAVAGPTVPWYANVYEISLAFGGREEGGWWYECGEPVLSEMCADENAARAKADELREQYPQTGQHTSVIYDGGDYRVCIERRPAEGYPDSRPHYC